MREIVFEVLQERPGVLRATAPGHRLSIEAASLEELHHEAREAVIDRLGAAHITYRIRLRRPAGSPAPAPAGEERRASGCGWALVAA